MFSFTPLISKERETKPCLVLPECERRTRVLTSPLTGMDCRGWKHRPIKSSTPFFRSVRKLERERERERERGRGREREMK